MILSLLPKHEVQIVELGMFLIVNTCMAAYKKKVSV